MATATLLPKPPMGKGSSKFRGVSWHKDNLKWRATIFKGEWRQVLSPSAACRTECFFSLPQAPMASYTRHGRGLHLRAEVPLPGPQAGPFPDHMCSCLLGLSKCMPLKKPADEPALPPPSSEAGH